MNSTKLTLPLLLLSAGLLVAVVWQARLIKELRLASHPPLSASSPSDGLVPPGSSSGSAGA